LLCCAASQQNEKSDQPKNRPEQKYFKMLCHIRPERNLSQFRAQFKD
jgi:hypothetical protein